MSERSIEQSHVPSKAANRFDRMEWAGAFGDLGTLIPFVVAYIGMVGMDPFGILFAVGVALIVCGAYYRTPMPVQPMKAAGAIAVTQAAQTAVITPGAVIGAGLATGAIWLLLGLSGTARRLAALVPRFVVIGIVLGLGMAFMLEGVKMIATGWLVATIGFVGTLLLLTNRAMPAMFLLLVFGAICGVIDDPGVLPQAVLGVILFLTGSQLALGSCDFSKDKVERCIALITAAFCVWNVGLGFVVGLAGAALHKRGLLRL